MHAVTATKGWPIGLELPTNESEFIKIRNLTDVGHEDVLCSDHIIDPNKVVEIRRKAEDEGHQINETVFFAFLQAAQNSPIEIKAHHIKANTKEKHDGTTYQKALQRLKDTIVME